MRHLRLSRSAEVSKLPCSSERESPRWERPSGQSWETRHARFRSRFLRRVFVAARPLLRDPRRVAPAGSESVPPRNVSCRYRTWLRRHNNVEACVFGGQRFEKGACLLKLLYSG